MQIKCKILSADMSSSTVQKGEYIPVPFLFEDNMTVRELRESMARVAWSLQKTYDLANAKRECRSVVFSFEYSSITGKPACVKD